MNKISKTSILPIVSVVCLGIGTITGHVINASIQNEIATYAAAIIGAGISIWGVIKNHKKEAAAPAKVIVAPQQAEQPTDNQPKG